MPLAFAISLMLASQTATTQAVRPPNPKPEPEQYVLICDVERKSFGQLRNEGRTHQGKAEVEKYQQRFTVDLAAGTIVRSLTINPDTQKSTAADKRIYSLKVTGEGWTFCDLNEGYACSPFVLENERTSSAVSNGGWRFDKDSKRVSKDYTLVTAWRNAPYYDFFVSTEQSSGTCKFEESKT